jgi:hypothetical protein
VARPSLIARLPADIRELIGRLRQDGRTIEEIRVKLLELDVAVSKSALGKHTKKLDAIGEQIRRSRAIGEALIAKLGEAPEHRTARLNIELMHSLVMDLLAGEDGQPVQLTPESAMLLSRALRDLAASAKSDAELEVKLRKELRGKVEKSLAKVEHNLGSAEAAGVPIAPEAVLKRIREEVYGILSP